MRDGSCVLAAGAAIAGVLSTACTTPTRVSDPARYTVTSTPLDTGGTGVALCLALDTSSEPAVWWWQPGRSGCASRSTGPDLFRASNVRVTGQPARQVSFALQVADVQSATGSQMVDISSTSRMDSFGRNGPDCGSRRIAGMI